MWQISSQTDFVPRRISTDFVPNRCRPIFNRFRPIFDRFRPIFDRFRPIFDRFRRIFDRFGPIFDRFPPIFDKFCPGLLIVWETVLCYTQNQALMDIIYSVILHSVLLQPICMELDFLKSLAYLLYGSVASLPSRSSNIEAWPYGTSLCFASLLHLGH